MRFKSVHYWIIVIKKHQSEVESTTGCYFRLHKRANFLNVCLALSPE